MKTDVHTRVTDAIIAAIEAGAGDWQMPWHRAGANLGRPVNVASGNAYRGINVLSLWAAAEARGFASATWGTYRQWQNRGCQVRRGETASTVVFYKEISIEERDQETGEIETGRRLMARMSSAFAADQVDGYEAPALPHADDPVTGVDAAERFVAGTYATIRHSGTRAFYSPGGDFIQMPERERFVGSATSSPTESYYATLLHELVHFTAPAHRCDRQLGQRFGDQAYAMEELVAELGAAFLCADLGVAVDPRPDHAAYIDSWLKVLRANNRAIFTAASAAARATDYLAALQPADTMEVAA